VGPDAAAVGLTHQERNILLETRPALCQQRLHFKPSHRPCVFPGPKCTMSSPGRGEVRPCPAEVVVSKVSMQRNGVSAGLGNLCVFGGLE